MMGNVLVRADDHAVLLVHELVHLGTDAHAGQIPVRGFMHLRVSHESARMKSVVGGICGRYGWWRGTVTPAMTIIIKIRNNFITLVYCLF